MFGGLTFLVNGNMSCGVEKKRLMIRVGPDQYKQTLKLKHARPMDFTGRPLKGFIYVSSEGFKSDTALKKWLEKGLEFARTLPAK